VIAIVIKGTNNPKGVFSGVTRTIGGQKGSSDPATLYNTFSIKTTIFYIKRHNVQNLSAREDTDYLSLWLYTSLSDLGRFSVSSSFYTVGRTPLTGDQPVGRPLPAHKTAQTQNKRTQASMPQVTFEPTIPVFQRAKTVHALGCAATAID
jgi:hypothetical protein